MRVSLVLVLVATTVACSNDSGTRPPDGGGAKDAAVQVEISFEDLVLACARVGSCGVQRARLKDCLDDYYNIRVKFGQKSLWAAQYKCVNEAKGDCNAVRDCIGFGVQVVACQPGYKPRCDSDIAYNCDLLAKWEQKIDCSKGGLKCAVRSAGTTTVAVCGGGPCTSSDPETQCIGSQVHQCGGGAIEIEDCGAQNLKCAYRKQSDIAVCQGKGGDCLPTNPQCNGLTNELLDCVEGKIFSISCKNVPGKKVCESGSQACEGTGKECDSGSSLDTCAGDALEVCIDGYKRQIDCKQLGFKTCTSTINGAICDEA
jgi:hypothetical protein